jgi:hypothetical protein
MPLYKVEDDADRTAFVMAPTIAGAIAKWAIAVAAEDRINPGEVEEPRGCRKICEDDELILENTFVRRLPKL